MSATPEELMAIIVDTKGILDEFMKYLVNLDERVKKIENRRN